MKKQFDCVVCGEICIDLPLHTVDRRMPLEQLKTVRVAPIHPGVGGIVSNSGLALGKLGMRTAAMGYVGDDVWEQVVRERFEAGGLDTTYLCRHPSEATSVTAVIVGKDGEHTFVYHSGASRCLVKSTLMENIDLFERTKYALFGYYALMPQLESDLPVVLQELQNVGCQTALDSAAGGGSLQPLDTILPYLDIYIPSYAEGLSQTGQKKPRDMIETFREFAPTALLGIKLGAEGALLSSEKNHWLTVEPVSPPGNVVDTTGAGDTFYAGLITGLCRGLELESASRLAAATGACCVTEVGASAGIRNFDETLAMI